MGQAVDGQGVAEPVGARTGLVARRHVVITGAASGIGRATAERLAADGHRLTLVCRPGTETRLAPLAKAGAAVVGCDLSRPREVARLAARLVAEGGAVDVLFCNAGVQPWRRERTPEGLELGFAVNVLAAYVLVRDSLPSLRRSSAPLVLVTGSLVEAWGAVRLDDLQSARDFDPNRAYWTQKLAVLQLVHHFAGLYRDAGIAVHAIEPGMTRTAFARHFRGFYRFMSIVWRPFMRRPEAVAAEIAALISRADLLETTGTNWHRGRPKQPSAAATDAVAARALAEACERLAAVG
ncbi:SDR family oxidoreductase [Methyloraptor flagellatus]|uniref:SDR family oxidoreductase n=1 Tax=Methyloraptor flagellatus TaxID=3162530 RepID=A0AAU7XFY4_9HYPH